MAEPYSLTSKHVLITRAGSGIGRLMALGSAQRGATRVVLWDINLDAAKAVAKEVESLGASALAMSVDVSKKSAVATAATKVLEKIGHLDVLVNNAGVVSGKTLLDLD